MSSNLCQGEVERVSVGEWRNRAPYRIHEPNERFKARYDANCHCGRVTYQISREEPVDCKLCHCGTCRKQQAVPFQWAATFYKTDIKFSSGQDDLEWYNPTEKRIEYKLPCKVRCSFCHSPLMDEGRNMIMLFPGLINLKTDRDRVSFKPTCHVFYSERVLDMPDGLPKWSGLNNKSNLIADSPPEMVLQLEKRQQEK